ncbi:MAG: hypothetical protein K0S49_187 [Microbacterium sp.]|jgi:hypothetical protein|nr:hypothetical protein [Microbacterium sp.]
MSSGASRDDAGATPFGTEALTAPLPEPGEAGLRGEAGRGASRMVAARAMFVSAVLVLGAGVLALLFVLSVQSIAGGSGLSWATIVIAAVMVLPLAVSRFDGMRRARQEADAALYRLERFATANRLDLRHREDDPPESATVFGLGKRRMATAVVTGSEPRPFRSADYAFDTWIGRYRMPRSLTYLRVGIATELPRASLVAVHAPGAPSWRPPEGQERTEIGGGFDEHFGVWCAPADGDGVRRMLTPSVRAGLAAVAPDVDVETAGRHVYFLSRGALPRWTAPFWRWTEDLLAVAARIEDAADPHPEPSPGGALRSTDAERAETRAHLFTRPAVGRPAAIGCLLPLVFGVVAGLLTATWR